MILAIEMECLHDNAMLFGTVSDVSLPSPPGIASMLISHPTEYSSFSPETGNDLSL